MNQPKLDALKMKHNETKTKNLKNQETIRNKEIELKKNIET